MLSFMNSALGLTIVNPKGGTPLIIRKNLDVFDDIKTILEENRLPADEAWNTIQELISDPLKQLSEWVRGFGIQFAYDEDSFSIEDVNLDRRSWTELLSKVKETSGDPKILTMLINSLDKELASSAKVHNRTYHIHRMLSGASSLNLLQILELPLEAKEGDLVNIDTYNQSVKHHLSYGNKVKALVSFNSTSVSEINGSLEPVEGFVLQVLNESDVLIYNDVMTQPVILGLGRTYRCEEFTGSDWVEIMSSDSLLEAQECRKEIIQEGFESRIINRISDRVVI